MATSKGGGAAPRKRRRRRSAKQEAKAAARAEHMQLALDFRRRGYTYHAIAETLSLPKDQGGVGRRVPVTTCYEWVQKAIEAIPQESAKAVRELELDRLNDLQTALYESVKMAASAGAPPPQGVIESILRIMDRRARYLGLYVEPNTREIARGAAVGAIEGLAAFKASLDEERPASVLRITGPAPADPVL